MTEKFHIVKKVAITDTLRNIPKGKTITFDCREVGTMASAKAAVSRLNTAAGKEIYTISSDNNGATYSVTHK